MKKFLHISLIAFYSLPLLLNGQSVIFQEEFDGSLGSWVTYNVTGPQEWTAGSFDNLTFARINGFDNGPIDNEDWLISPPIDISTTENEILTFETASNFDGPDLEVYYATNYDGSSNPNNDGNWTDITDDVTLSPGDFEFVSSGQIDLSGISTTTFRIAFRYLSSTQDQAKVWEVDNVVITATNTSSTTDLSKQRLISQPVVADGLLQFDLLNPAADVNFGIYDLSGRALQSRTIQPMTTNVQVPVQGFSTGMYLLVARSEKAITTYKFIVQ